MNVSAVQVTDSSLLLWALAAIVTFMCARVCLGWLTIARLTPQLRENWLATMIATFVLGTGICAAVVLGLSAEALPFPLGYRLRNVLFLWPLAVLGCWPAMMLLGCRNRWYATVGAAVLVGLVAMAVQYGWVDAAGLRPGIVWRKEVIAVAGAFLVATFGLSFAWGLYVPQTGMGRRQGISRHGAGLTMALALLAGQQILLGGTNIMAQVGSVYRTEVPASMLCLVLGVLLPLGLTMALLDLRWRRRQHRRELRRERRHSYSASRAASTSAASTVPLSSRQEHSPG
jgi:NO-binding membrane sensor protein with MHYT domain